jgi:hypothetical protein
MSLSVEQIHDAGIAYARKVTADAKVTMGAANLVKRERIVVAIAWEDGYRACLEEVRQFMRDAAP